MSRQIASLVRRFPALVRLPYLIYQRARPRYTLGAAAVILNESGAVLLVEHVYHPRFAWGLPGGWVDFDEDPAVGIVRELHEELTLSARVSRVLHVAKTARSHIDIAYLCVAESSVGKLSHELLAYRWAAESDLPLLKPFHARAIELARQDLRSAG
ncbi:MAG: NUDIX hydrolase [Chloroflexi bacterium]|nr:NUDIX hydrolase [Chloroflexota bacterium]MCY3581425.1 NUDIX hydrolase [Chloroflexota bacterium]MCY3717258.1 NUDIX hydrolase [Chloroflexota bacterium]MDE2651452.1 NUDIX hydrolase [Chloroflexota bacterium]